MRIEHSQLHNEFISFWFETSVDGVVRYDTFIDFLRSEWYTCKSGTDGPIVLRGTLALNVPEDEAVDRAKCIVEDAITGGSLLLFHGAK